VKKFKKIILVTGTPGVGKTTVSNKLASKLNALCVGITDLVREKRLFASVDEARQTLIADTEEVSNHLQEIVKSSKGNIIIEGHYAVDVVPKEEVDTVFVLRRDPSELKEKLEQRGFVGKKLWENLAAEILDVCLLDALVACGEEKVCEIDVSSKSVEEVMEEMIMVLENSKACRSGIVDWLGKLEDEGCLGEFLRDF
jgi:adenylate kinase